MPYLIDENEEFATKFKKLIQHTYEKNGGKKVVIISHSFGCLYTLHFLQNAKESWKDTYIREWISIAGPFGGSLTALTRVTEGIRIGETYVYQDSVRALIRSWASIPFLFPTKEVFGNDIILSYHKGHSIEHYTVDDMPKILEIFGAKKVTQMWEDSKGFHDLSHPGVDVFCIAGNSIPTTEKIDYSEEPKSHGHFDLNKNTVGDGAINSKSAEKCKEWSEGDKKFKFSSLALGHRELILNKEGIKLILTELAGLTDN